ncbi:macro domain-containing protein [Natronorubrum tibetense]|uniref:Appr-1-p processing protein n=1 Tax=Natronorubrum tibetense GA33 TaxID=1114856 RepID=L9VET4_9EURY|nr:macro domain-containing protein [Natronorubrum tibetense]ELY35536.1 Appr-1-p processing protein [Natronorubrum tibetense GA33]
MHFAVVQGNIAKQSAHVLVNSTSPDATMNCGVAAALQREADGPLKTDVVRTSDVSCDEVVVTDAYNLSARYVIHAVPFTSEGSVTEHSISAATRAVLSRTDEMECRSLVLPVLGCGGGGYDLSDGTRHICEAILAFDSTALADVRLIAHTADNFEAVRSAALAAKQSESLLNKA